MFRKFATTNTRHPHDIDFNDPAIDGGQDFVLCPRGLMSEYNLFFSCRAIQMHSNPRYTYVENHFRITPVLLEISIG